jgi:Ca2+-binding RTX toxin-like protein
MNYHKPPLRRAILAAGAVIATAGPAVLFAAPANAAPTITFTGGVLTINGDASNNGLVVGQTPAHIVTLNGSPVLGGTVPVANVQVVRMNGGAGDDTLKLDETNGPMPAGELDGGPGNNTLIGGSQADTLTGGNGIDRAIGGPGDDTVSLGDGSDQFTWNPGDGNDHVDGNAGTDTLIFNGSDHHPSGRFETESLSFDSDGTRTTITWQRNRQSPPSSEENTMSLSGFELVKAPMAGGPNTVSFGPGISGSPGFSRSDVRVVRVDLGPPIDPSQNFGHVNEADVTGTAGPDRIRILDQNRGSPAAGATITGLGTTGEIITGAQNLTVLGDPFGASANDVIDAGGLSAGTVGVLREDGDSFGGAGNDTLIGHPGTDQLFGGAGNDRLEGRGGAGDVLDGGTGHDIIIP